MDKVQSWGKNVSASFTPFAARTQQFVKEQLGQADDKTQLPPDYVELEKRIDALKQVHNKMLTVTSQYSNEAYDYPPNIRESFVDLSRNVTEKIQLLSTASTPAEAQSALTAPSSQPPQPKTFSHAISRAALNSSHLLPASDPLSSALEKYALASEAVGEGRIKQDKAICTNFNAGFQTTLNTGIKFAQKARNNVENARLLLDAAKARQKAALEGGNAGPASFFGAGGKKDAQQLELEAEEHRVEVENLEDEFVSAMEEAVSVMKNVLDTPEPLRNLAEMINAQLEYHKRCVEILQETAGVVDALQVEQESSYRKSREGTS